MTNVHISPDFAMTAPGIPEKNTIHKKTFVALSYSNIYALAAFTRICGRLKQDRNSFINTVSVDISFIKNDYSKNQYSKHIAYLVGCGLIVKTGSNKSWTYLVNPKAFHCLTFEQKQTDWPAHLHLFPVIVIPAAV